MDFQIQALPIEPFREYFDLSDRELERKNIKRLIVSEYPGMPCRVSMEDAKIGEQVILLNYEHLSAPSPFQSKHAIFVREHAKQARIAPNQIPEVLRSRVISLRAFDKQAMIVSAEVIDGNKLQDAITEMLENNEVNFIDLHFAKPGCFAARATHTDDTSQC